MDSAPFCSLVDPGGEGALPIHRRRIMLVYFYKIYYIIPESVASAEEYSKNVPQKASRPNIRANNRALAEECAVVQQGVGLPHWPGTLVVPGAGTFTARGRRVQRLSRRCRSQGAGDRPPGDDCYPAEPAFAGFAGGF